PGSSPPPSVPSAGSSRAERDTEDSMLDLTAISRRTLNDQPYDWAEIGGLFSERDAGALADAYPRDHFKTLSGHDGEKQFLYEARNLIGMGAAAASYPAELARPWLDLARDLLAPDYRA